MTYWITPEELEVIRKHDLICSQPTAPSNQIALKSKPAQFKTISASVQEPVADIGAGTVSDLEVDTHAKTRTQTKTYTQRDTALSTGVSVHKTIPGLPVAVCAEDNVMAVELTVRRSKRKRNSVASYTGISLGRNTGTNESRAREQGHNKVKKKNTRVAGRSDRIK
ncbi:hypothetical protein SARC_15001, partial [Sphaeroforma arctica JP610]